MKKYLTIWYNLDCEVKREYIDVEDDQDPESAAYLKYGGIDNSPSKMVSMILEVK